MYQTIPSYRPHQGLAGYGMVAEIAGAALQVGTAAYGIYGPKPNVNVDAVIYSAQPPPPVYRNFTPALVIGGVALIALVMIGTHK